MHLCFVTILPIKYTVSMNYIHHPYQPGDTIAAIATPPGEGGVAIIRISGRDAFLVGSRVFSGPVDCYVSHTVHFGHVLNAQREHVDDVLILPMRGPRSYTGEDTIEIHCHGGSLVTRRVLDVVLKAGARAALPGEFTFKAFMNGKMDLAQAEAVQELICAKNERALDAAESQLQGALSEKIGGYQKALTAIAAILEAWVDFPEEGLEFASFEEVCKELEQICKEMESLHATFHEGKILHEGIALCLIGSPNVGKSSLMNALLDKNRAIVSPFAGTTRDVLEDDLRLNGLNFRLMDTAGIRDSEEIIEQEGVRRSKDAMQKADLILFVLDASRGLTLSDEQVLSEIPQQKTLVVWNKIDLPHTSLPSLPLPHVVALSAKTKQGMDQLKHQIDAIVWQRGPPSREEVLITNMRHYEALAEAIAACRRLYEGLGSQVSPEFLSLDMRQCLKGLGKVIGTDITEDILTAVFSKFCIGK